MTARILAAALLACAGPCAFALQSGTLAGGGSWVTGGIGSDEAAIMQAQRLVHDLAILTAAKKSGAFLADAHVSVTDAAGKPVFDGDMDGPWLVMDLPPGQYTVEVTAAGQTQRRTTELRPPHGRRELFFYFDADADVLPAGAARD